MSTTTHTNANDILMGGGGMFASFKEHGDSIAGTVTHIGEPYQQRDWNNATGRADGPPKVTKAGKPVMAFHVTLTTDERDGGEDDGTRILDVNAWRMQDALRAAIRATGAPGLEIGAQLSVTYTHDEVPGDNRSGKHYTATYVRATNAALMGTQPAPAAQPATATPPVAPTAPVAAPAPAPAAAGGDNPAEKAKQLIQLGLDEATIATATGLDPTVVTAIVTAIRAA